MARPASRTRGRGRPTTDEGLREVIRQAALTQFAEAGYSGTSLRKIAGAAGVDPSLVLHYFGSKEELFAAALTPPVDFSVVIPQLLSAPESQRAERVAQFIVQLLDRPEPRQTMTAAVRSATPTGGADVQVRRAITTQVIRPLAEALQSDHPELRAAMLGSQMVGLVMARHVVGLPTVAELTSEDLVAIIAPVVQRYLFDPLGLAATGPTEVRG
ncbi:MAG: TetR family transcriptional regulator [Actinobacteria bacterium]|nr:TetR family transcriptional regulator [Actinomycetota bacterium]